METGVLFLFQIIVLVFSVVIHEFSHGWMANQLGDPTAKYQGRLTLNPRAHLDFWGSFLVPLFLFLLSGGRFLFGWAKPVPYNPYNLRNQRYGPALVGLAGPGANLVVAAVFGLALRFLLAGEVITVASPLFLFFSIIVILNILLAIFNLIPIPPLDGSKVLFAFLPYSLENVRIFLERFGFIILLFFIFFLFQWIYPLIFGIFQLLVGQSLLF